MDRVFGPGETSRPSFPRPERRAKNSRRNGATIRSDGDVAEERFRASLPAPNPKFPMHENDLGRNILDAAFHVHRSLGPGLLESVYETVLAYELQKRGLAVRRQVPIPIEYECLTFDEGFRADLIVADKVIIELKSVTQITPAHRKQIQTYLRLSGLKLGYLINFGEALLRDGIVRAVNGLAEEPSALPEV